MVVQFLNQLRVLFPRWNFFDQLGHRFHVKYRTNQNKNWNLIEFNSQWKLLNFFCNPTHNLTLAQMSAIELLAQDVQSHDDDNVPNLDSFRIVKSIVQAHANTHELQFQIEAYKDEIKTILYTSPWINEVET